MRILDDQEDAAQTSGKTTVPPTVEKPASEQQQPNGHQEKRDREERIAKIAKRRRSIRRRSYVRPIVESVAGLATAGIFIFTIVYSYYAGIQARAAKEMVIATKKNAVASDRPWIGPTHLSVENIRADQAPKITLTITNYGKSPSIGTEMKLGAYVVPNDPTSQDIVNMIASPNSSVSKTGTIFPNQLIGTDLPTQPLPADRVGKIIDRTQKLVVVGAITYRDTSLQALHHTWLYAMYAPDRNDMMIQRPANLPPDD